MWKTEATERALERNSRLATASDADSNGYGIPYGYRSSDRDRSRVEQMVKDLETLPIAKAKGFTTTGIVSSQAQAAEATLSPHVEHVFYIPDETWGGFQEDSDQLSPTSAAMVENSDTLIGIGGGAVARDELLVAQRCGKPVRFIPADLEHAKARQAAQAAGLPPPRDFVGEAHGVFGEQASEPLESR